MASTQIFNPSDTVFAAAADAYGLPISILKKAAEDDIKFGQPPILEIEKQKEIANERHLSGDLNSPENRWQIYLFYLAEQTAAKLDEPKVILTENTIKISDPDAAMADLQKLALEPAKPQHHPGIIGHIHDAFSSIGHFFGRITHTSTGTAYVPSDAGLAFVKKMEGLQKVGVEHKEDPRGVVTIGYGHTNGAISNPGIAVAGRKMDDAEATPLLIADMKDYGAAITQKFPGFLNLPQGMQDACVSYAFNCGVGALMKSQAMGLIKDGHLQEGAAAFANGIHTAKGVPLPGLVNRRAAETQLAMMDLPSTNLAPQIAANKTVNNNLGKHVELNAQPSDKGRTVIADAAIKPAPVHAPMPTVHPAVIAAQTLAATLNPHA